MNRSSGEPPSALRNPIRRSDLEDMNALATSLLDSTADDHDPLTGLLDLSGFRTHFVESAERVRARALLVVNLDQLELLNDELGEATADAVVRQTARRLRSSTRPGDVVGRLGAAQFAILTASAVPPQAAMAIARRVRCRLRTEFELDGHAVSITGSIGVVMVGPHCGVDDALAAAERAAASTQRNGGDGILLTSC